MDKKKIIIVSGTGGILGTGHLQRMLSLAVNLNRTTDFSANIALKQNDIPIDEKFSYLLVDSIPPDADLIIRDMRDSSPEEIKLLKQIAPVIVIDDSGPGSKMAEYAINLLPLPLENLRINKPDKSLFLYGYNFSEGIKLLSEKYSFKRDIDVAVYAGYNPPHELVTSIRNAVPESGSSVILKGGKIFTLTGGFSQTEISYAEVLVRTKIIITHFGLTMFEADACGCAIAALNPTEYHAELTGTVRNDFKIIYSSQYNTFSQDELSREIRYELAKYDGDLFSLSEVLEKINNGMEKFIDIIRQIITGLN